MCSTHFKYVPPGLNFLDRLCCIILHSLSGFWLLVLQPHSRRVGLLGFFYLKVSRLLITWNFFVNDHLLVRKPYFGWISVALKLLLPAIVFLWLDKMHASFIRFRYSQILKKIKAMPVFINTNFQHCFFIIDSWLCLPLVKSKFS